VSRLLDDDKLVRASGYKIKYHPKGAVKELFSNHDDEICLAGPAGTGKTLGILHRCHLVLSKYPGARGFISRKTRASMTNSCLKTFDNHVLKPPDRVHFHKQDQIYFYPNKSELAVIGLDDPERIKSTDWDFGFINEATECSENDAEICTTRLRNWVVPYQQLIYDCNPDRPTHWLKKRADSGLCTMLKSYHKDNPRLWDENNQKWTPEGEKYLAKLRKLSGHRLARLYRGEWVAAEGVVYEGWDPLLHMVNLADLPLGWDEWPHLWCLDWGYQHPLVWGDWIEDPEGRLYLFRQIYQTKMLVEDLAAAVMEITKDDPPPYAIICDHDATDRATFERRTGYKTLPAYKSINTGIQAVQKRLESNWVGRPGLFIIRDSLVKEDTALSTIGKPFKTEDEFDGYSWPDNREKVKDYNQKKDEVPIDKDNHGMDMVRYAVAFVDSLADDPSEFSLIETLGDETEQLISPY
jgi:hypothetical protein